MSSPTTPYSPAPRISIARDGRTIILSDSNGVLPSFDLAPWVLAGVTFEHDLDGTLCHLRIRCEGGVSIAGGVSDE